MSKVAFEKTASIVLKAGTSGKHHKVHRNTQRSGQNGSITCHKELKSLGYRVCARKCTSVMDVKTCLYA